MKARDNPFSTDRLHRIRYRLQGTTWDALLDRLEQLDFQAAIVGPDGSGKTTLLEDVAPRLKARGFEVVEAFLDSEHTVLTRAQLGRFLPGVGDEDARRVLLLDGADRIRPRTWQWFRRKLAKPAALVITSHAPGMLHTLIECRTSAELLRSIVSELCPHDPAAQDARELFDKHGGNIRAALRDLYDKYRRLP